MKCNQNNIMPLSTNQRKTLHIMSNYSKDRLIEYLKTYFPSLEQEHTCVIVENPDGKNMTIQF